MKTVYLPPSLDENNTTELYSKYLTSHGYNIQLAPINSSAVYLPWKNADLVIPPIILKETTFWKRLEEIAPNLNTPNVKKAFYLSKQIHGTQARDNNRPYFNEHILPVTLYYLISAHKLKLPLQEHLLITCLLHDIIEDSNGKVIAFIKNKPENTNPIILETEFSEKVAQLITILTKPKIADKETKLKTYASNIETSEEAIFIKCIDRILNLASDIEHIEIKDIEKVKRYTNETKKYFVHLFDKTNPYYKEIVEIIIGVIENKKI